jgi:hypothetical protein
MSDLVCECGFRHAADNESEAVCPACGEAGSDPMEPWVDDMFAEAVAILECIAVAPSFIDGNDLLN